MKVIYISRHFLFTIYPHTFCLLINIYNFNPNTAHLRSVFMVNDIIFTSFYCCLKNLHFLHFLSDTRHFASGSYVFLPQHVSLSSTRSYLKQLGFSSSQNLSFSTPASSQILRYSFCVKPVMALISFIVMIISSSFVLMNLSYLFLLN